MHNLRESLGTVRERVFIGSSILFNILVSTIYVLSKLDQMTLVRAAGVAVIMLIVPFTYTLHRFLRDKEEKQIIISNALIILYLLVELFLDYVLLIPFREIYAIHIPYILVFYAAEFSIIGVSFKLNRRMGFVVLATFFLLILCLIYSYL